jgi:hypothetical protein
LSFRFFGRIQIRVCRFQPIVFLWLPEDGIKQGFPEFLPFGCTQNFIFSILPKLPRAGSPSGPQRPASGLRAGAMPCRGHPWPLSLPLVGGPCPSNPHHRAKERPPFRTAFLAPPRGFEPRTQWLTVRRMPCLRYLTLLVSAYNIKTYIHKPTPRLSKKRAKSQVFC